MTEPPPASWAAMRWMLNGVVTAPPVSDRVGAMRLPQRDEGAAVGSPLGGMPEVQSHLP